MTDVMFDESLLFTHKNREKYFLISGLFVVNHFDTTRYTQHMYTHERDGPVCPSLHLFISKKEKLVFQKKKNSF